MKIKLINLTDKQLKLEDLIEYNDIDVINVSGKIIIINGMTMWGPKIKLSSFFPDYSPYQVTIDFWYGIIFILHNKVLLRFFWNSK
jgi:hypothetical protein